MKSPKRDPPKELWTATVSALFFIISMVLVFLAVTQGDIVYLFFSNLLLIGAWLLATTAYSKVRKSEIKLLNKLPNKT